MAVTVDMMEYPTHELAQAAYVSSDAEAIEENFETGGDANGIVGDWVGTESRKAVKFTTSGSIICSSASIYLNGVHGSPVGDMTFRIETDDDNKPSGSLVHANGTGTVANASISTSAWNKCSFTPFDLSAGTYWLVISIPDQADNTGWTWYRDNDGIGTSGNDAGKNGVWEIFTNEKIYYFRIYALHLQCYSESTIKQQGTYSLKGIAAAADSLNDTLTRTVDPTIDLSGQPRMYLYIRASRTGSHIKVGIHDSGGVTTEVTPNIASANTWQAVEVDISAVADGDKDDIDSIIVTVVNADADNTFYLDDMYGGLVIVSRERNIVYDSILELSKTRDIVYDSVLELSKTRDILYDSVLELSRERNIVYDLFELIQRLEAPTGVWTKQDRPVDGAVKQERPTGVWQKQDKPS